MMGASASSIFYEDSHDDCSAFSNIDLVMKLKRLSLYGKPSPMKLLSTVLGLCLVASAMFTSSSCTKETIIQKDSVIVRHDSIIIRKDSIVYRQDVLKFLPKKWYLQNHEIESYSNGNLTQKKVENFVVNNFYNEFRSNGSYTNFDLGGTTNGTWSLVDDNLYVLDKNTSNERYYYILSISGSNLIIRGPFTKDNRLYTNFLFTAYFKGAQ